MKISCEKCKREFDTETKDYWVSGSPFEGIDRHHNPPEEFFRFLEREWVGEYYNLCRKCHKELHKEITIILKKYSLKPKYNSDYWLMLNMTPEKIGLATKEIYEFTKKWANKNDSC